MNKTLMQESIRGSDISKTIHGCCTILVCVVANIALATIICSKLGLAYAILGCITFTYGCKIVSRILSRWENKAVTGLSLYDCLVPFAVSVVCGIAFAPIELLAGNLFSSATCIYSGFLLTLGLFSYRGGRINNPYWLLMPTMTFVYEILPIDLPTPIDNILALSANSIHYILLKGHEK